LWALLALGGCAGSDENAQEGVASIAALSLDGGSASPPVALGIATEDGELLPPVALDAGLRPILDAGLIRSDGGGPDGGSPQPIGVWHLDDCTAGSTILIDSSPTGSNAQRSAGLACAEGISGQGVRFDERRDTLEASSPSAFTLSQAMTVGAWVNPASAGQGSIVNKEEPNGLTFELSLDRKKVTFSVTVQKKRRAQLISSSVAIPLNEWTHVAGSYDGEFVRLFRNGQQVGQVSAPGSIADTSAPIRIGNNRANQFFPGRIDEVQLFNRALAEFEIPGLSCIAHDPALVVTPSHGGSVDPDVTVPFDIAFTNNNVGGCSSTAFFLSFPPPPTGVTVSTSRGLLQVPSGQTTHVSVAVTGTMDAVPGDLVLPFTMQVLGSSRNVSRLSGQLQLTLNAPTGCFVRTGRELLMRDLSVVEDPIRTTFDASSEDPRRAAWTFARVMEQIAPTAAQAPAMVEQMFRTWLSDQTINTFAVPARTQMSEVVLNRWPRSPDGTLDLTRAPLRLLAIVNRPDLRDLAKGKAGEGRFVFGVLDEGGFPMEFTLILEYRLPGSTVEDVLSWSGQWHALGALPFPSEEYNTALQALTTRFAGRNAAPGQPNGSALLRLRTNEIALSDRWELREFTLSPSTGMLEPSPVELTPDTNLINESQLVADYVNQNEAAILLEQHVVPEVFQGSRFLAGSSFNDLAAWRSSGIVNPEARFHFSLNTCNGCHSDEETGTPFLHVNPRSPGEVAELSGFMTGISVPDPVTGVARTLNDLGRRNKDLKNVVCSQSDDTLPAPVLFSVRGAPSVAPSREQFLSRGIGRVH
jgi:hypothetical protein